MKKAFTAIFLVCAGTLAKVNQALMRREIKHHHLPPELVTFTMEKHDLDSQPSHRNNGEF
jgi:hypothetical protein